jgi:SPP1 family predicted phage head-tail adaptor
MAAGKLDRRVRIQRRSGITDAFGGESEVWIDGGAVWASRKDVSDAESIRAQEVGGSISCRFRMRWSSITSAIGSRDRLLCEGRLYEVTGTKEIGRREYVEISATARTEGGA